MANTKKYEYSDLLKYKNKEITIEDLCAKYNVKRVTMWKALNRANINTRKKRIEIVTPYQKRVVESMADCAYELQVSLSTIIRALKGERVKMFDEMGITLRLLDE